MVMSTSCSGAGAGTRSGGKAPSGPGAVQAVRSNVPLNVCVSFIIVV